MWPVLLLSLLALVAADLTTFKVMYYSPAVIGEDPHVGKIDLYTTYFSNLHERDIPIMEKLGVTHVMVSDNWAADGSPWAHRNFLDKLNQTKTKMKLIVTYAIPTGDEEMSAADFLVLRDKAKQAFISLMEEFSMNGWGTLLYGYNIPAPPIDKLSLKELGMYYEMVNDLRSLQESIQDENRHALFVGYPIDPMYGKPLSFDFKGVKATVFTMNVYTTDAKLINQKVKEYSKSVGSPPRPILPILHVANFNRDNQTRDDVRQATNLRAMWNGMKSSNLVTYWGSAIMEFSDEWWRADLSTAGYSVEGCPNGNAYAHTSCGIAVPQDILSLEYMGMFEILDMPFHFCLVAKPAFKVLQELWGNTEEFDSQACITINFIIPWYIVVGLGVVSIVCLVLILAIPPPTPPKKKYTEMLQMSGGL